MTRLPVFLAALMIAAAPANAASWHFLGSTSQAGEESFYYVEATTLKQKGQTATAWVTRVSYDKGAYQEASRSLHRYDCAERTSAYISISTFDASKAITTNKGTGDIHHIAPGTAADGALSFACEVRTATEMVDLAMGGVEDPFVDADTRANLSAATR